MIKLLPQIVGYLFSQLKNDICILQSNRKVYQDKDDKEWEEKEIDLPNNDDPSALHIAYMTNVQLSEEVAVDCLKYAEAEWNLPPNWKQSCLLHKVKYMIIGHIQGSHMEFKRLSNVTALARSTTFPVAGGLFTGGKGTWPMFPADYLAHGVEFIHLQLPVEGAKGIEALAL